MELTSVSEDWLYIYIGPNRINFIFSHNDEGRMSPRTLCKLFRIEKNKTGGSLCT